MVSAKPLPTSPAERPRPRWRRQTARVRRRAARVRRRVNRDRRALRLALRRMRRADVGSRQHPGERLVPSPVFVLSSIRSGSTLLRVLLNSHSEICAPHEMHLRTVRVRFDKTYTELAMEQLALDVEGLEHLLWDRVLYRELQRSGKRIVVDKTPGNSAIWRRLATAWPDARFIFLLRHPAAMVASMARARPDKPVEVHVRRIAAYVRQVEAARAALPGLTVRYEDLTADPEAVMRQVCAFLGVPFEPRMLDYGEAGKHGPFRVGIGDWSLKIKSGRIQPATPPPGEDEMAPEVRKLAAACGY